MLDLYFEEKYGLLYEDIERGKCEIFEYHSGFGVVRHLFIKRPIPVSLKGELYYDLVTPYGYGGPVILECDKQNRKVLVKEFEHSFADYCRKNNIVSEFVRFHPVLQNAQDFCNCYELTFRRKTTGTNLRDYEEPIKNEFSKSKQKSIQKAIQAGLEYKVTLKPENLDDFQKIYHDTMKRKNAEEVYFFGKEYFSRLLEYLGEHVLLVEVIHKDKVIGMGLNFVYGKMIHIHLSGTCQEFQYLAPSVMLRYALVQWGKNRGIELIHEGGGRSSSLDDPLYVFKKQFGKNTDFNYYVSSKIWDEKRFEALRQAADSEDVTVDFPADRQKISGI